MARYPSTGSPAPDDLTAKARIRYAALDLFARRGVEATALRAVAASAGVTVGLIVHHYGTKKALQEAVELAIVEKFAGAIASVPLGSLPAQQLASARNDAVADMLAADPAVVDYLRRSLLEADPSPGDLVSRLSELTAAQVRELREVGVASSRHPVGEQVLSIMVAQLGRLVLQPLIDRIAGEFTDDADSARTPRLAVSLTR